MIVTMINNLIARVLHNPLVMGAFLLFACSSCSGDDSAATPPAKPATAKGSTIPEIRLVPAFPKLTFKRPVWMEQAPGDANSVFVIEQAGRVLVFDKSKDSDKPEVFLDIVDKTLSYAHGGHDEEGMLALAFDPDFAKNRTFYIHYNASKPRRGIIASFKTEKDNPLRADMDSEEVILEVEKPFGNHCGCCLRFGPDGYLYATFGDGGAAGDPHKNGQKLDTLLGKMLRIDVRREEGGLKYAIPKDNPFVDRKGTRPEIWAYGLRNAWRMSFDPATGDLWTGDVGQNLWEEIDIVTKGGNYGWRAREGAHVFDAKSDTPDKPIDPVVEYGRRDGWSVTGGYVYRGKRQASLQGVYIYGDYVFGTIWGLRYKDGKVIDHRVLLKQPKNIASFAEDADGEVYVLAFDGKIYRIEAK